VAIAELDKYAVRRFVRCRKIRIPITVQISGYEAARPNPPLK
jgi:hypothetical protein